MNNKEKILKLLHKVFRHDVIAGEISKVTGQKLDKIELSINDIENQNFLDTATWGLELFEEELAINQIKSKPLSDRRAVIRAKWRGVGTLTLELIKQTVAAYTNANANIIFDGHIFIEFNSFIGRLPNINDVYKTIEDIKPAHIGVEYKFKCRIWEETCVVTWKNIKNREVTWNMLKETEFKFWSWEETSIMTWETLKNKEMKWDMWKETGFKYWTWEEISMMTWGTLKSKEMKWNMWKGFD